MHITRLATVIAQAQHARVQDIIIRHQHPAFTGRKSFGPMKTKRRHIAQRPRLAPTALTANRLGGILHNQQPVLLGNRPQCIIIRHAAIQVHR